ncbi:uncharacterized protein LOC133895856 [Phragmites australis]|uniref:uncharacterized protein LOC133895856 n=1 Tax=Phragmites australis TaxID=29695 RepID=UPI002D79C2EC|nr:uncharacterized protein LOC133895856 [Phragmites australis]
MEDQQERAGQFRAVDIASLAQELREQRAAANSSAAQLDGVSAIIIAEVDGPTRNVDPAEYDPHHVSIGPYHRIKNPGLARDDEKIRSLDAIMSAASPSTTEEVYLGELARLEGRARRCYAHTFGMESKEFLTMLLLDGCYVLAHFGDVQTVDGVRRRSGGPAVNGHVQGAFHRSSAEPEAVAVVRDVFYLAENQIPFFVVDMIRKLTISYDGVLEVDPIAGYVREILDKHQYSVATPAVVEPGNLLHLLHMHLRPTILSPATGDEATPTGLPVGRWRTAMEYRFVGVKFKSRPIGITDKARCILDVSFDSGGNTLEVPCLNIDAETFRILRNLMALEKHNPDAAGSSVTAYCVFMSQMACTEGDVELLSRIGVIVHRLGNHKEVSTWFSDLCKGVVFDADDPDRNYLRAMCQALEKRFRSRPRRWMALLGQKYFANPWLGVGVIAAAIGLACAVVQAVYSVLSYRQGAVK